MPIDKKTSELEDLQRLLGPIYAQALAFARRLSGSLADGDDLFQEAAIRALEKLPGLRDEDGFRSWFYQILLSVHRNRARRAFWRRFLSFEVLTGRPEPVGEDGGRWEDERHRAARVARALSTLPAEQREAVVLFEVEGFSLEEIADLQSASLSAVKSRLLRGRERLRRYYQRLGFTGAEAPTEPRPTASAGSVPIGRRHG